MSRTFQAKSFIYVNEALFNFRDIVLNIKKSNYLAGSKERTIIKKILLITSLCIFTITPIKSFAFSDGSGWVAVSYLIKLVEQAIRQYLQLQQIYQSSQDAQAFLRQINSGTDNLIPLLKALPIKDEKILGQLESFQRSLSEIEKIYGSIPKSPDELMQRTNDLTVAESLKMVSNANQYAERQEDNANLIEQRSWDASPKGAMRMQAQVSSQILLTLNQILKMNSQLLKMQSAQFAFQNSEDKQDVVRHKQISQDVAKTSKSFSGSMDLPKF